MRLAVVAGQNRAQGLGDLLYAEDDAGRLASLLVELSRFQAGDVSLLRGASAGGVVEALRKAGGKVAAAPEDSLLLFFFSGHADGENLLLGDEKLSLAELKEELSRCGAAVTLLLLDACNSGAAARMKGGRSAPSFLRLERIANARGRVVLASSSAAELSQESDDIRGSFFTHFLLSGLRGEADKSNDRLVTLAELYDYVYDRTLERTSATLAGPQHPAFLYELSGEGGLVLSDLNAETTGLLLEGTDGAEWLLVHKPSRQVVAEVRPPAGTVRLVPLLPGRYLVKKRLADHLLVGEVDIQNGERIRPDEAAFAREEFEDPRAKGWALADLDLPRLEAVALGGWTALSRSPAGGVWSWPFGGIGLRLSGWPARRLEAEFAATAGSYRHSLSAGGGRVPFALVHVEANGALRAVLRYGPFEAAGGGMILAGMAQRRFSGEGLSATDQSFATGAAATGRISFALGAGRLSLVLDGGVQFFAGADRTVCPFGTASLSLSMGL